jgi:hypothetical protein
MALGSREIELIIQLRKEGYLGGKLSVAEIGAQQLNDSFLEARSQLELARKLFGVEKPCPIPKLAAGSTRGGCLDQLSESAPLARDFWTWLGFDYTSFDIDGAGDSVPLDLNYDSVPHEFVGEFRLVTNYGTTEHIANQLNAFKAIHDFAAAGAVMIHHVPMQGMLGHGLIAYDMKFFWMLARSNTYRVVHVSISTDGHYRSLSQNLIDAVAPFDPDITAWQEKFRFTNAGLVVVLQKLTEVPFVAPIDVPTDPAQYLLTSPSSSTLLTPLPPGLSGWDLQRELLSRYRQRVRRWFRL